jgi:leucyl-tRNA synthetase
MREYDHKKIEKKWQAVWEKKKIYQAQSKSKKPKFYSLIEFPYPSGAGMHVGHIRSNTAMDIISRKRRMEGFNVLYPIGWDAFGLPTENYAIKTGIQPAVVTKKNTDTFRKQLKALGFSFDWSREINTTDPKYYKWTQWIFLQFLKKGLAYKAKMTINWCPKDKIGLANEEVVNGCCERCGTAVEKREKEQWMLAITKYADRLDKDLDKVDFLEKIKIQQRNWIGKSEGAEINFTIENSSENIKVFTTRPDTIYGATYLVLAPEHELVSKLKPKIVNSGEVLNYVLAAKAKDDTERTKTEKEKTGVELKGVHAINPATGEPIPVWIADYVLAHYGTGAIMAVPAHDDRDFEFANKFRLPIKQVIAPIYDGVRDDDRPKPNMPFTDRPAIVAIVKHWEDDSFLLLDWQKVAWHTLITGGIEEGQTGEEAARREILEETGYRNLKLVKKLIPFHSRFYHTPKARNQFAHFETFYFELVDEEQEKIADEEQVKHKLKWVPREKVLEQLTASGQKVLFQYLLKPSAIVDPGLLINSGRFDGLDSEKAKKQIINFVGGEEKTTYKLRDWVFSRQRYWGEPIPVIHCGGCGVVPVPEKDLPVKLPKVKNYQPTDSGESPLANISKWVNTKCPKCKGKARRETDTMPNWAGSSWYYLRYTDPKNVKSFADGKNLNYFTPVDWYNGGMEHTTLHLLYSRFWHKFLYDLKLVPTSEPYMKRTSHGMILAAEGEKMSKSKGNVVNPDDIVATYGADTLRLYEMFMGPFDQSVSWSTDSLIGPRRFLEKVWKIGEKVSKDKNFSGLLQPSAGTFPVQNSSLLKLLNKTIKKVSEDIEEMRFNTAISSMMILATEMDKADVVSVDDFKMFIQILNPFAPHVAEELWSLLGEKKSINISQWPKWDESKIKDEEIKIMVQVNGKLRGEIFVSLNETEENIKKQAVSNEAVLRHTGGGEIKKVIYVKNRLVNIVL